jgi:hypothetical protein
MLTQIVENIQNLKKDNYKCTTYNLTNRNTSTNKKPDSYKNISSSSLIIINNMNKLEKNK